MAVCLLELKGFTNKDFAKYHPGGSLGKKLYLKVNDLLKNTVMPKVNPNSSIKDTILEISEKRFGATAVVDDDNILLGIITDGDIRRMLEKSLNITNTFAKNIMSKSPKTVTINTMAIDAFNIMEENKITQLTVVDENKYIGIIHLHDLLNEGIV